MTTTLLPLWEMAHEEKPMRQGYYIQPESRLLMRREQPQDPSKVRPWKIYDQVVVPRGFRNHITGLAHDSLSMGHLGPSKTLKRIKRRFFWPGIRADVKRFCHSCGPCQRAGKGQKSTIAPLKPLPIISQPIRFISADFVGPMKKTINGNQYILNIIDHATKYSESFPFAAATADNAQKALIETISRHGKPETLLTDRGSAFIAHSFTRFLAENDIRHLTSSSYRPQTNGAIDKYNGTLKTMLKILGETTVEPWDEMLPWLLFAYRSAEHSSTGYSPLNLLYGREPRDNLDSTYDRWARNERAEGIPIENYVQELCHRIAEALREASENAQQAADGRKTKYDRNKKAKMSEFQSGAFVLVRLPLKGMKLKNAFHGPYLVHEKVASHTYIIYMPDKRVKYRVMHVNQLKPWTGREDCAAIAESSPRMTPQTLPY